MNLKSIFQKPVDRPIEGVIKADDEKSLRTEFEEYVLTNEVAQRLEEFLDSYNNYQGANGVWVSGFFGSGKSHLLKILAFLLENRQIDGVKAADLFLPKCNDNEILRGDLKRAVAIPSKSLLFNIDQKADVISKTQLDALLAVFVKVFDEACGYYGKQAYIAKFERDLDGRGQYEAFMAVYETVSGYAWHTGREQSLLEEVNIAKAYAQVAGVDEQAAVGILDKYRDHYRVSIEDFAEQVNTFIGQQVPGFRLNFFVDEVGQYIADNVKLMTNLQTIAESLATKCEGRAWVLVTAQEDMATVVGEMTKQQANDFSKIQARFKKRMKLTSADVAEVIQKRLLLKNEVGVAELTTIYHEQSNNFKTLFDFADGAKTYRNFQDRDHFIHSYPFIPYQFALFQAAIENLSAQNAFEGKNSSVGERSMLGVFQEVAVHISDHQLGQLATFDLMFEGLRTSLKSRIQRAVLSAEQHLDDKFAVRVLKALFLVKYVKEFKATVRNLCVLMLSRFDEDLQALRRRVEEALNLLEQQTYVQRNGEIFEYLTDEEKDVEQEIKNTDVDTGDVLDELEKIVFDNVIKNRKIRYEVGTSSGGGYDYPFGRKLDDRPHGRESELSIHVITPFHDKADQEHILVSQSMGRAELLVIMPPDDRLLRDLAMYKKTEKYVRQNISISQQDSTKRILNEKAVQNRSRLVTIGSRVEELLRSAKLFVEGSRIESGATDAQTRIVRGFCDLVTRVYPNLKMLRGVTYTEDDISRYLDKSQANLAHTDATNLSEAEQEILSHVQIQNGGGQRVTLKSTLEVFERKPYGWSYPGILCITAQLCARGKIELRVDGNIVEDDGIERALRNTHGHALVILTPQVDFTASQIRDLKEFYSTFFDQPSANTEPKALAKDTLLGFERMSSALRDLALQQAQYPFLASLAPIADQLQGFANKNYSWCLSELKRQSDDLLELKERTIDPIRKFMSGKQKEIYDEARRFVQENQANFSYLAGEDADFVSSILSDPACYRGQKLQQLKERLDVLKQTLTDVIQRERLAAGTKIEELRSKLCGMTDFAALKQEQKEIVESAFAECRVALEKHSLIPILRDTARSFEDQKYSQLLGNLAHWSAPPTAPSAPIKGSTAESQAANSSKGPSSGPIEVISRNQVSVAFDQAWLATESDVERYLEALKTGLLVEIRKGRRIQV